MKGTKVALRAVEPADATIIHEWENDMDIWQLSNTITPFSRYIIEQYILNSDQDIYTSKQLRLMIDRIDGPKAVAAGAIDLFDFEPMHRRAGVGILISKAQRNEGLASESLELLKTYAFETLQLRQLYCNITADNQGSLALFQKHGFVACGTRKDWLLIKGVWTDEIMLQCFNHRIEQ
jgi:diamine N-acetyltransferase